MKKASRLSSWGTTPIERLVWRGAVSRSWPQIVTRPAVLITSRARMLMKVDLPAPVGPKRPNSEPRGIARSTCFSASLGGMLPLPR